MLAPLLFAAALSAAINNSSQTDTIPSGHEQEANEAAQVFRDHYIAGYYPPFAGPITRIAAGAYRLDSFTMQMDTSSIALIGLFSRGLLFPGRLAPFFASTDTLSIGYLYELNRVSYLPDVRRFSCWVYSSRIANPIWYVFELTNEQATANMDMATFIQNARLTFLYQVCVII